MLGKAIQGHTPVSTSTMDVSTPQSTTTGAPGNAAIQRELGVLPRASGTLLDAPEDEILAWLFGERSDETVSADELTAWRAQLLSVRAPDQIERHTLTLPQRSRGSAEIGTATGAYNGHPDEAFYMLYVGEDAEKHHWAQFVWAEAFGQKRTGDWINLGGERLKSSSVGPYTFTPGGTLEESGAPTSPSHITLDMQLEGWKDDTGLQNAGAVGAVDSPGSKREDMEALLFDRDLSAIKLRQHYDVFLIKSGRHVQSHARITMDWAVQERPSAGEGLAAVPAVAITAVELPSEGELPEPFREVFQKYSPGVSEKL